MDNSKAFSKEDLPDQFLINKIRIERESHTKLLEVISNN